MSTDNGYERPDPTVPVLYPTEAKLAEIAARRKRKLTHGIILSGWILILLTMVTIMGAALAMMWQGRIVPDKLADWAGIALGFLFGTFATIVKDFIQDAPD